MVANSFLLSAKRNASKDTCFWAQGQTGGGYDNGVLSVNEKMFSTGSTKSTP